MESNTLTKPCAIAPCKEDRSHNPLMRRGLGAKNLAPSCAIHGAEIRVRTLTKLDCLLIDWALDHWPRAGLAITDNYHDGQKVGVWLGSIVRAIVLADPQRRAQAGIDPGTAEDPMWLFRVALSHAQDLLDLSPWLGVIRWSDMGYPAGWGELPGPEGWTQWVKDVELCSGPFFAAGAAVEHLEEYVRPEMPAPAVEPAKAAAPRMSREERNARSESLQKVKSERAPVVPAGMLF